MARLSMDLERRAENLMVARRDAAGQALKDLQSATDARTAYTPPALMPLASLQMEG
jgi:hypothetical protein